METIASIETTVVVTWSQVAVLERYLLVTEYVSHRQIRNNGIVDIMLSIGMPNITMPSRSSREIGWRASANNNMIVVIRSSAKGSFLRFSDDCIRFGLVKSASAGGYRWLASRCHPSFNLAY